MCCSEWGLQPVVKRMQVTQSDSMEEYQFTRRVKEVREPAFILGPPVLEEDPRSKRFSSAAAADDDEHPRVKRARVDSE